METYYLMEKVECRHPTTGFAEFVIIMYDTGTGHSVGKGVEPLDNNSDKKFTNVALDSLGGSEFGSKQVCKLHLNVDIGTPINVDVWVPWNSLPQPKPQDMYYFKKLQ